MAKGINKTKSISQKTIEQYEHKDKYRVNNPPVGLVDEGTEPYIRKKQTYKYDPHLDPQLQWAGKAEHTSFDVPTVSLHVHERIDPRRIIETVKMEAEAPTQMSLFEEQKKPLREAIEFYKHNENWSNRLVAGDSLLVMNSLLEKEGMGGKVQMMFFDPPYGIKYGSNFQPFVNKRDVKDGKDDDLTAEPEMIKAFRDTWELGIHSYLTYLRDRLWLAKDLLHESGSVFVQISDENLHHVREIMDEVFGKENYCSIIVFRKTGAESSKLTAVTTDYLVWYARDISKVKYNQLYFEKIPGQEGAKEYKRIEYPDGTERPLTDEELNDNKLIPKEAKVFATWPIVSPGESEENSKDLDFIHEGKKITLKCPPNSHWKVGVEGTRKLWDMGRMLKQQGVRIYKKYLEDFPYSPINSLWIDTRGETNMKYVVQTSQLVIQKCILMTSEPGDLIFDPTCGSGTTAFVAERWGRRWITCDTSRVAITLAKQRIMTANFDYFQLAHPNEGVGSGFKYENSENKIMSSVANNITGILVTLYDRPLIDTKKTRVTGPFTIEAVPAPIAKSFEEIETEANTEADSSISRSGESLRQDEWKNRLKIGGVRGRKGEIINFTRVETLSGTRFLQAEAETKEVKPKRVVICFGPEHAPLEQRMVELALEEARTLKPKPEIILFCAFQFDPEARKDIEETNWPGITLLEAQMDQDLLTEDLKKKPKDKYSPAFWLIGQPDVRIKKIKNGDQNGKSIIEVHGFDYYNPKTGTVDSGGKGDIAMWMLDHDYDGRSMFPSQVFFPMAGAKDGWTSLAKNLKADIDLEKIEAFGGTVSLPFTAGKNVAVKIIDARGIESLKIIRL